MTIRQNLFNAYVEARLHAERARIAARRLGRKLTEEEARKAEIVIDERRMDELRASIAAYNASARTDSPSAQSNEHDGENSQEVGHQPPELHPSERPQGKGSPV